MTRSRFVHRSRPCDASLQQYDLLGPCHWLPTGAARAYHQAPRHVEKTGEDCVVWIREQHCREILGQLAKAASVERPIFNSEAFRLGAAKDAMCRSFMAVVTANLVDAARVTDTLGVWKVFQDRMGLVDCTYGLTEVWYDVHRGLRRRGVMGPPFFGDSARGQEQERKPWPEWMLPTPATAAPPDPSAPVLCQLWFGSVGKQVYAQANDAFEQVFMSTARVRQVLAKSRLMSFYLWRLIVSTADMSAFYDRFVEALFAKEVNEAFLIARCHTVREEQVPFLISIAAHFAPGPDGLPVRGYCVRLWPTKPGSIDHYLTPPGEARRMEGGGEQGVVRAAMEGERLLQGEPSMTRSELVPP